MNRDVIETLQEANKHMTEDHAAKLDEMIIQSKEQKMLQDEINQKMKDAVEMNS